MNDKLSKQSKVWLSLSEAADLLGVHFTTLRRWADQGDIAVFRTPGGRRRFNVQVLAQFLSQRNAAALQPPAILENRLVNHTRHNLQRDPSIVESWSSRLTPEQIADLRQTGNRLTALLIQYSSRPVNGETFLEEGKRIAAEYANVCFQVGLPIAQTVRTFQFFQRSILDAVHETDFLTEIDHKDTGQLFSRTAYFFDEAILALIHQYFLLVNPPSLDK